MEYLIGVVVALIVQVAKKISNTTTFGTYVFLLAMSLVGAGIYYMLSVSAYWEATLQIAAIAAGFHNLVIRRFEETK
ncbi:hypothetical protein DRQ25_00845 [Candidatus Fermentibacteria bacterium]|nr:MAG: hypothetical protein DRQ25_00845 [Candidatus Fermentibacteria bacterium]